MLLWLAAALFLAEIAPEKHQPHRLLTNNKTDMSGIKKTRNIGVDRLLRGPLSKTDEILPCARHTMSQSNTETANEEAPRVILNSLRCHKIENIILLDSWVSASCYDCVVQEA